LPYDHPQPPVKWSRADERQFVFTSPSNDLRFLGIMVLHACCIEEYSPPGDVVVVLWIAVGFVSNLMLAVYRENVLIMNYGGHRGARGLVVLTAPVSPRGTAGTASRRSPRRSPTRRARWGESSGRGGCGG